MLESGLSGSVRGVPSNGHPYRDPRSSSPVRPCQERVCSSPHCCRDARVLALPALAAPIPRITWSVCSDLISD